MVKLKPKEVWVTVFKSLWWKLGRVQLKKSLQLHHSAVGLKLSKKLPPIRPVSAPTRESSTSRAGAAIAPAARRRKSVSTAATLPQHSNSTLRLQCHRLHFHPVNKKKEWQNPSRVPLLENNSVRQQQQKKMSSKSTTNHCLLIICLLT